MTTTNDIGGGNEHDTATSQRRSRRPGLFTVGAIVLTTVVGAGTVAAFASGDGFGPGRGHHDGGMGHGMRGGPHIERMLEGADVTDEQRERIRAILDEARDEGEPVFAGFRDARGRMVEILSQPEIDREAAETLLAEQVAAIEAASTRMLDTLIEVAEVLTPEQRAVLAERMEDFRPRRR